MGVVEARLARLRGEQPARRQNARTIAALTSNPGCGRRAVLDAAGIDKERVAQRVGFPAGFGQSQFAIVRGNAFERRVKADGCAELAALLREALGVELGRVEYVDLGARPDGADGLRGRQADARDRLLAALAKSGGADGAGGVLFGHPLLLLDVGGQDVYLEPDLVVARPDGVLHVVEIKSFPVIDGQADGAQVAAAATQAAVYVTALRRLLGRPGAVSHDVVLVCPKDFANVPVATPIDVRRQLIVLDHQLARLTRIEALLAGLPEDLRLDPAVPAAGLAAGLGRLLARYSPGCLSTCELAFFCREEAGGATAALGTSVREELGGVETVAEVLGLAHGTHPAGDDQAEAAQLLRTAARVYAEALAAAGQAEPVGAGASA
ncbi:MAG: hypothetical protein IRZ08_19635 [Frankia sp.]|nr:hypothetical protein [Frankia sp.]